MDGGFANLEAGRPVSDEVSGLGSARGMSKSEAGAAELTGATNKEQEGEEEGGEEEKTKEKTKSVGLYPLLLEFTTPLDIIFMIVGTISSIVVGMTTPYFILVFGDILDGLNGTDIRDVVAGLVTLFAVTGVVALAAGFLAVACWNLAGERTSLRIKKKYIESILRQDIGWFDEHPPGELPSAVIGAMAKIQDGIGRKVSDIIVNFTMFIATFAIAFTIMPKLAAVMLAAFPFIAISTVLVIGVVTKSSKRGANSYSKAGGVANEVITAVRTISSLTAERNELTRYSGHLAAAEKAGITGGLQQGLGFGVMFMSFFLGYALAFWYGTKLVADDMDAGCVNNCHTGGEVITTIFGVLVGAMGMGQMSPGLTALTLAKQAGYGVFEVIHRVPVIDSFSKEGEQPKIEGRLDFEEVDFSYPARPDQKVFESVSLSVSPGETVALVGPSGGGKSTMTKLILRFYDVTSGAVKLDGHDVRSLNVAYYRAKIGFVGQEPVLFSGSIMDNIASGKPGATEGEVVTAAKQANAHMFIKSFPDGYATDVGSGGLQLSGGQKQRIAIARAIIKDPAILLLDEATSALDSESEKVVQEALDHLKTARKYTTIVIAHRLSTVQNSDRIAVVAGGRIAEIGTHSELLDMNGIYATLCSTQIASVSAQTKGNAVADGQEGIGRQPSAESSTAGGPGEEAVIRRQSSSFFQKMTKEGEEQDTNRGPGKGEAEELPEPPLSRMWALSKPEWFYISFGAIGAALAGTIFPLEGIIIAHIQTNLYLEDADQIRQGGFDWAMAFVGLALLTFLGNTLSSYGFSVAGERLTRRLREMCFKAILRHDMTWFDKDDHAVGVLTANLEEDASKVKLATGTNLANKIQLTVTLLMGVLISLIYAWQIGLVAIVLVPLMAAAAFVQMAMVNGSYGDDEGLNGGNEAAKILGGALNAMTTVTAFNLQGKTSEDYNKAIKDSIVDRTQRGYVSAAAFGYSQGIMFWVFAVLFYYGSILVANGDVTFLDFFTAAFSVILGGFGAGQVNSEVNAVKNAKQAASRIFRMEDDEFPIDPLGEGGAKGSTVTAASVSFEGIKFAYPERPDAQVYGSEEFPQGFNLEVKAGETMALVGPSGGGKSTCIQLLLRFYDPLEGRVKVDQRDIRELNVHWLRSQMGYVGQEPVLFTGSIRENILRGKPNATEEEVVAAAKAAFAHDFIEQFSDGYNTDVGEKSALLSGGQKQRIAVARAIINEPTILLLDEATSALDNDSERQVQEALDSIQVTNKCTTIVVAHRLTTIRNADRIAVISSGGVKELGTHDELIAKKGIYAKLYKQQTEKFTQD